MQEHQDSNNKESSGYTIKQIEWKMKKYGLEISLVVIFILSAIFALVWGGAWLTWSILLSMIFAIVGTLIPKSAHKISTSALRFIYKEKVTSITVGVIGVIVSIFLPPIIFACVGLLAGKSCSRDAFMEDASFESEDNNRNVG